jgi:hypothetical protein
MEIIYSDEAQKDIVFWKKSGNLSIQKKSPNCFMLLSRTPTKV